MKLPQRLVLCLGLLCAVPAALPAASAPAAAAVEPGVITGYVYNPITKEYVRNAEVVVEGTSLAAITEGDGSYRLVGVPTGPAVLRVRYTGYEAVTAALVMEADAGRTQNFELSKPTAVRAGKDETIVLEGFVVSAEREGNAKAIMSQRRSMDITNSVASDVFGDVAEGNIAEFLKHLAGVDLDSVEGDVRTVRLRGLSAEYTAVTLDGVSLASADANTSGSGNSRAFSFEQVSLNSMDSIEISKTVSADVDANAPAGTINLKSKRAFDRKGRRIAWQANVGMNSSDFTLSRTNGPDNAQRRKIEPGGMLEYSDVFLNRKLGIVLNISESNTYAISARSTLAYNREASDVDPRVVVPTSMALTIGPRITERFTTTLTADYKVSPKLNFGLTVISNYNDYWFDMRTATFTTHNADKKVPAARATVKGDDLLMALQATSTSSAKLAVTAQGIAKAGETWTYIPRFEYRIGRLKLEGKFAYSDSRSWYDPMGRRGSVVSSGAMTNVSTFTAARSALKRSDWQFAQTGGKSWSDGANFTTPTLQVDDGRTSRSKIGSGQIDGSFTVGSKPAIQIKTGLKTKEEQRTYANRRANTYYTYEGPNAATWKTAYNMPYDLDLSMLDGGSAVSNTGGTIFMPDVQKLANLFREHPEYFKRAATAANYYSANILNMKDYTENVSAAYLMGTTNLRKATFRVGMRWEGTRTDSLEFDQRTKGEMAAAGYALVKNDDAGMLATTVDGVKYQFESKPLVHRKGYYDNFFPSASFKYRFLPNLDLHVGYAKTIRRPDFSDISGIWSVNEEAHTVEMPNAGLKPELSNNYSARLAYYFEPVGVIAVNYFVNTVRNLHQKMYKLSAADVGYTGTDYAGYEFTTTLMSPEKVEIRGFEFEYNQSLSFLPKPFSGLNVRATYTRNDSSVKVVDMSPHAATAGLNYTFRRLNIYSSVNWTDDRPLGTYGNYRRHRTTTDVGGSFALGRGMSLFFAARNVFNVPNINLQEYPGEAAFAVNYGYYGTAWTFGVKGTF
ncbi:TonB-dependent receptor [Opitutus sp. ER46]|uniref:TonB-dependent receptor domain-containing protein n=1 Tax=Opitutus sp. ER46 TaxID=2161864 RepID=UPI001304CF35|nr:TonB-dependent receptor [Opitutus sp. ER46]